jgi:hypothetical protein
MSFRRSRVLLIENFMACKCHQMRFIPCIAHTKEKEKAKIEVIIKSNLFASTTIVETDDSV